MSATLPTMDNRVDVLVDCDNVGPDVLEHALRMAAQFGRVILRRGYGNQGALAHRWQEALVRQAFTPCLQYQYAAGGKNTADIALALDALEALFDHRADTFCIVTSDSDFAYLCRKLRERGATVCIVGEPKTPDALRNASDQFFEWSKTEFKAEALAETPVTVEKPATPEKVAPARADLQKPLPKRRPRFLVEAVSLLAGSTSEGKVGLGTLGQYLKRTDPAFSPQTYGHSGFEPTTSSSRGRRMEANGRWAWPPNQTRAPERSPSRTPESIARRISRIAARSHWNEKTGRAARFF